MPVIIAELQQCRLAQDNGVNVLRARIPLLVLQGSRLFHRISSALMPVSSIVQWHGGCRPRQRPFELHELDLD